MRRLSIKAGVEEAGRWIDIIYPPRCAVCGRFLSTGDSDVICPECRSGLRKAHSPLCSRCGVPFDTGPKEDRLCERCLRDPPSYKAARALYVYEGPMVEAVHRFKYAGKTHLAGIFGPLLAESARACLPPESDPLIVPVPLHVKRLRKRGFNQSLLLARHVEDLTGFALDSLSLRRVRETPSQAALGKDKRRVNVREAFAVKSSLAIKGRDVLLVDDVSTTGSTLDACSRTLLRSGARRVFGLTLARAPAHRA